MSKRTSGGSGSSSKAPTRILVDRCISSSFAAVLRRAGIECSSLAEVFGNARAEKMQDIEWIQWASANGYAVLTSNPKMLKVGAEIEALLEHGTLVFCIGNAQTTKEDKAYVVGRHILSIMRKMQAGEACFWRLYMRPPIRYDI